MGDRKSELENLYTVIIYVWKEILKKYDYRTITDAEWEMLVGDFNSKYESLIKTDPPMAELLKVMVFGAIDYLTPRQRDARIKERNNDKRD